MRILIDGYSLSVGGGVKHYINNILMYMNSDITLLYKKNPIMRKNITLFHYKIHNILTRLIYEHIVIPLFALYKGMDIIFIPKSYAPILRLKPQVTVLHDIIPSQKNGGEKWYVRLYWKIQFFSACRYADGLIFSNKLVYNEVKRKYPFIKNKKIKIIPYGYDNYEKQKQYENKYILIPATIKKRKNILLAIKIAEKIQEKFNKKIIITGRIEDKKIYNTISNNDNIKFLGYIPRDDMMYYFNNAFVIVYLSAMEGFSLPIAESIYLNKNIIAMDTKLHRFLYNNYPIYYNNNTDFYENIEKIYNKLSYRRETNNEKIFTWKNNARKTEQFLKDILYKT